MTTTQEIKPGDVIVLRNSGIGDFDPPMTLTIIVDKVDSGDYAHGVAVYATDFEDYEIDGETIVPGPVAEITGAWPIEGAVVIAHGATA